MILNYVQDQYQSIKGFPHAWQNELPRVFLCEQWAQVVSLPSFPISSRTLKAEYNLSDDELVERAYDRMIGAGMDLIVANDVSREKTGFGTDTNEVFIIDKNKTIQHVALVDKYIVATSIREVVRGNI